MARQVSGTVRSYFRRRAATYMFLIVVFAMGSISGAFSVKTLSSQQRDDLASYVQTFLHGFAATNTTASLGTIRQTLLESIAKTVGVMWLLGLSVLGAPFVLALLFLRGFVLGFTVGFMVKEMVLKGIALAVVSVVPHNLLVVPAIILAGGASLGFSWAALQTLLGRRDINMYQHFLSTTLLVMAACGLMGIAALVEAYITPMLIETATRYLT
ncbi:MAG: stage II sporulation protein M [Firmicutes bacterium]|jgi:stage II sporulation protein M|nr:stage II sporulation protein M [Bacillota bacterium]